MTQIEFTDRELVILDFVLTDLAEAIEDGDRAEFTADEVGELVKKVRVAQAKTYGSET